MADNMITTDEVKKITLSKKDFDVKKFEPFLEVAEKEFIKPFLNNPLYNEVRTQYLSDSLSTLNTTLVGHLKKALAWYVLHKALPFIQMDITNSGIQINNTEYASSGTDKQRGDLVGSALNNGNTLLNEAKEYIEDPAVINSYPLYTKNGNISNNTNITGGIVFDDEDDC